MNGLTVSGVARHGHQRSGRLPESAISTADGNAILWRNVSGGQWLMNWTTFRGLLGVVPNVWQIAGVGEYRGTVKSSGSGKAGILWRNTSGEVFRG